MSKFDNLVKLSSFGFNVPTFYKISSINQFESISIKNKEKKFAIRSSSNVEDGVKYSFAGIFDSFLNIPFEKIPEYCQLVFDSAKKDQVKEYCHTLNLDYDKIEMDVIIQEFMNFEISGVAFINDSNNIIIECVLGLGEGLVNSEFEPDHISITEEGDINYMVAAQFKKKAPSTSFELESTEVDLLQQCMRKMSLNQINELTKILKNIKTKMNYAADVEWGFYKNNFYIVQCRPITKDINY